MIMRVISKKCKPKGARDSLNPSNIGIKPRASNVELETFREVIKSNNHENPKSSAYLPKKISCPL